MEINQRESIVGLVEGNLAGGIGDLSVDGDHCFVFSMDGRGHGSTGGTSMLADVFFDDLLFSNLVDDILSVLKEERGHFDE